MMNTDRAFTAWLCDDCMLTNAGYDMRELGVELDHTPLSRIPAMALVTDGMLAAEHQCESRWLGHQSLIGCGEELRDFDTSDCGGCGSHLAGVRHAVTVWTVNA